MQQPVAARRPVPLLALLRTRGGRGAAVGGDAGRDVGGVGGAAERMERDALAQLPK